jgi:hypothetical protein
MKKFWSVTKKDSSGKLVVCSKTLKNGHVATRFTTRDIAIALASKLTEQTGVKHIVVAASREVNAIETPVPATTKRVAKVTYIG